MRTQTSIVASLLALSIGATSSTYAEENKVKADAKEVGHAVGTAAREVAQGTKKVAKKVGKATKEAARETGHAFRDGAKEFKKAVHGEGEPAKK